MLLPASNIHVYLYVCDSLVLSREKLIVSLRKGRDIEAYPKRAEKCGVPPY
jgi:hypothetical protein